MIVIRVKDGESIDRALRRYKKKFERTGILKNVRERMYYKKPSVERKEMMKKARNRQAYYAKENY
jgi:small subunit ribosomal protein S21